MHTDSDYQFLSAKQNYSSRHSVFFLFFLLLLLLLLFFLFFLLLFFIRKQILQNQQTIHMKCQAFFSL